ncbi:MULTISPECIES: GTPase Era [Reichenbachiella]|uniref:GTPase Era n=1 Tax=Reichenbachiella agariperforans TaxID=156994 RepID=A0A1M6UCG1_REIAG|nr:MULTISPECIES: GTPase Era [Reichenbachiella]MBU2912572.1 GTPase Era [Reichenbachiella agariperforans]RJE72572.1 GTPase Era [Reichenbachiella sp. MSK19-1]SHK66853.1 GTP-binding protein Era [Reichenbachiella agariperforans]
MEETNFKSGFVSIIGKPNAGKSTLMNALVGDNLSIITSKAQTTRHRIMGVLTGDNFQIVYSDTPGLLKPQYSLQKSMMSFVSSSLEDADLVLYVVDLMEKQDEDEEVLERVINSGTPVIFVINKTDLNKGSRLKDKIDYWELIHPDIEILTLSALTKTNVDVLFARILELLPLHPPYFPQDTLTDKPERFFASEIVREQIFKIYKQEVPYSSEVEITSFEEEEDIIRLRAEIIVERKSQKGIIIGKGGEAIKKVGIESRLQLEKFFGKKVFIETFVKVEADWRKKDRSLKRFGYKG